MLRNLYEIENPYCPLRRSRGTSPIGEARDSANLINRATNCDLALKDTWAEPIISNSWRSHTDFILYYLCFILLLRRSDKLRFIYLRTENRSILRKSSFFIFSVTIPLLIMSAISAGSCKVAKTSPPVQATNINTCHQ